MSSFRKFLARSYPQTAVYWANPQENGYGGKTYDDPVEIKCRWEDKQQVIVDDNGEQLLSRSVVWGNMDFQYNGMLFLGTLADLDSSEEEDPRSIEGICIIKRFEKTPYLGSTTIFLRKAYLTPWLT